MRRSGLPGRRRPRTEGDGKITDPGAAIMDVAWPSLARAWLSSRLGQNSKLEDAFASFESIYDLPPAGQYSGWHIPMDKDLRTLLGQRVQGKFKLRYCGGGSLKSCRQQLWRALDQAGNTLQRTQGSDPSAWRSDAVRERIHFTPGLLPYTMRYTNRPSGIQQVLSFGGHDPADTGR